MRPGHDGEVNIEGPSVGNREIVKRKVGSDTPPGAAAPARANILLNFQRGFVDIPLKGILNITIGAVEGGHGGKVGHWRGGPANCSTNHDGWVDGSIGGDIFRRLNLNGNALRFST